MFSGRKRGRGVWTYFEYNEQQRKSTCLVEMGKNPKLWVLVRVRVLGKAGSVRVRVLCIPSKFGFGSVRVLRDSGFGSGSSS
jgi:hypothetical protein